MHAMRRCLAAMLTALLIATHVPVASAYESRDAVPSGGAMAFDLLIVRPMGVVATVLGAGFFVLSLPFTVGTENGPENAGEKLVAEPARFTFTRPLGQMD